MRKSLLPLLVLKRMSAWENLCSLEFLNVKTTDPLLLSFSSHCLLFFLFRFSLETLVPSSSVRVSRTERNLVMREEEEGSERTEGRSLRGRERRSKVSYCKEYETRTSIHASFFSFLVKFLPLLLLLSLLRLVRKKATGGN